MPDDTPTALPPLDPRERARVHAWLRRYGRPTGGFSPLTERYAARYRAYLGLWQQRRADRTLAAAMRHRAARPVDVAAVDLLGGWFFVAATGMYPGALAVGAGSVLLATHPTDRALSVAFTVAAALCTAYAVAVLGHVVNRPGIAESEHDLTDDDTLRREDARLAVAPYLAVLAVVATASTGRGGALRWVYLGYAVAATLAWSASMYASRRWRNAGTGRPAASHQTARS